MINDLPIQWTFETHYDITRTDIITVMDFTRWMLIFTTVWFVVELGSAEEICGVD